MVWIKLWKSLQTIIEFLLDIIESEGRKVKWDLSRYHHLCRNLLVIWMKWDCKVLVWPVILIRLPPAATVVSLSLALVFWQTACHFKFQPDLLFSFLYQPEVLNTSIKVLPNPFMTIHNCKTTSNLVQTLQLPLCQTWMKQLRINK